MNILQWRLISGLFKGLVKTIDHSDCVTGYYACDTIEE